MPTKLSKRPWIAVTPDSTFADVATRMERSGGPHATDLIIVLRNGYMAMTPFEFAGLGFSLQRNLRELSGLRISDVLSSLARYLARAISMDDAAAGKHQFERCVLVDGGEVRGAAFEDVFVLNLPKDRVLDHPLGAVYHGVLSDPDDISLPNDISLAEESAVDSEESGARVTLPSPHQSRSPTPPSPPPPAAGSIPSTENALPQKVTGQRYINAEVEKKGGLAKLAVGEPFQIHFDVDVEKRGEALASEPLGLADSAFDGRDEPVELSVKVVSHDFEVESNTAQVLRVPRRGESLNRASFTLKGTHEGMGTLTAVFLRDGNFVQLMTLTLEMGQPVPNAVAWSTTLGRPVDDVPSGPRDLTLVFRKAVDGFDVTLVDSVAAIARLPLTDGQLASMVEQARTALLQIVYSKDATGRQPYLDGIDIPTETNEASLQALAKAGFRLFQQIFFGPAAGADSHAIGDRIRERAQHGPLQIQIVSQNFLMPWAMLYMANALAIQEKVDAKLFLGFSHDIEHIPLQQSMAVNESQIRSKPQLRVSINVNHDIDNAKGPPVVAPQVAYWTSNADRIGRVTVRTTGKEVTGALTDPACEDQLVYFYCHASTKSLTAPGGPDASSLTLSGGDRLTLGDLYLNAATNISLAGTPLLILNACESAELSPLFYDGFVPYFVSRGARGVVGTECLVPALFAACWARAFFDRFLGGLPLGRTVREVRRHFLERHRNVLGLLYAQYCDGDTRVAPGISLVATA